MEHYHLCWLDDGGGDVVAEAGDASQHSKIINGDVDAKPDPAVRVLVQIHPPAIPQYCGDAVSTSV
jgi:hypothetical protein